MSKAQIDLTAERERQGALLKKLVIFALVLVVLGAAGIIAGKAMSGIFLLMGLIGLGFAAYLRRLISDRQR
jgi:hypothetical protein